MPVELPAQILTVHGKWWASIRSAMPYAGGSHSPDTCCSTADTPQVMPNASASEAAHETETKTSAVLYCHGMIS